ncbi:MAG: hypothetical protein OEY70_09790 [Acidimicrobiia bacterium]|nr:hypothetical protein [Acidimicrobiia bacterium]
MAAAVGRAAGPVAMTVGALLVAAVVLVQTTLLNPATYLEALDSVDAYERAYSDVLADPGVAARQSEVIGRLGPSSEAERQEVRAATVQALHLVLPPDRLRAGADTTVHQTVAYLRGDIPPMDGEITVADLVAWLGQPREVELRAALARAADQVADTLEAYETLVVTFADELAAGRVPMSVPVYGGTSFDPERIVDLVLDRIGPLVDDRTRSRIVAAVGEGREREALITAAVTVLADEARTLAMQLRDPATTSRDLTMVRAVSERAGTLGPTPLARLNTLRTAVGWLGWRTAGIGAGVVAAGAAGVSRRHRRRPAAAASAVGLSLVAAGLAAGVLWAVGVRGALTPAAAAPVPVAPVTSTASVAPMPVPPLPTTHRAGGAAQLAADVEARVLDRFDLRVGQGVVLLAGAGAVLAVGATARRHGRLRPVRTVGLLGLALGSATLAGPPTAFLPAGPDVATCNGHAELCDRRYDQTVMAATHNAMSSPGLVRVWPEQGRDLRGQLDGGVRALLIDTHYWEPVVSRRQQAADVAPPSPNAALLARALQPLTSREPGTWLCHLACGLGARPLADGLGDVRAFLDDNPGEVVTLIIQDRVSPADTEMAFEEAGLESYLFDADVDGGWPTLGEMVDSGRRLVVFAESGRPGPAWYRPAFDHIQETPFRARQASDLSCEAGRGGAGSELFLLNHWVLGIVPDRATAAALNRRDAVVERAQQCQAERGRLPTFVAVDFAELGDVAGAVDELNGLAPPALASRPA